METRSTSQAVGGGEVFLDRDGVYEDIEGSLDDVRRIRDNSVLAQVLGSTTLCDLAAGEQTVRRCMGEGFELVVVGEFKRGKSTLINALLGEDLAPVAVTPETLTWNRISYAEQEEIRLVLANRRTVRISREELRRKQLCKVLEELPAPLDYIDIRVCNEFLKEITLIDTPGLDDVSSEFSDQVAQRLASADAIIYVVSALAPLSQSEIAFLSSSVVPQGFTRLFLVVNMSDRLETLENLQIIKRDVELRALPVSERISVHLLSALDERRRQAGGERLCGELTDALEQNFLFFEAALRNDILLQKSLIKLQRAISLSVRYLEEVASRLALTRDLLAAGVGELEQNVSSFEASDEGLRLQLDSQKQALAEQIQDMRREATGWTRAYLERMRAELSIAADEVSANDVQRYVQFYIMDSIRDAIMACVRRHETEINDVLLGRAHGVSAELAGKLPKNVQATVVDSIRDYSWTSADSVSFVGSVLEQGGISPGSGVFAPFYLLAQSIVGTVRQRTMATQQHDVLAPVIEAWDRISCEVIKSIDEIYLKLTVAAQDELERVVARQMEVSREALENARAILADKTLETQHVLDELAWAIQLVQRDLTALRALQAD